MKTLFEALAVLLGMFVMLLFWAVSIVVSLGFYLLLFAGAVWIAATVWKGVM